MTADLLCFRVSSLPRFRTLAVAILHSEPAARQAPVDVVVGAAGEARRTLHTVLVGRRGLLPVPAVDIGGAERRGGAGPLASTSCQADIVFADSDWDLVFVLFGQQGEAL